MDGEQTLIQLDADAEGIGLNYRMAVGIVADAKLGLAALADEIDRRFAGRAYVKIDPKNHTHVQQAIQMFGGVYLGFQVQQNCIQDFNSHKPWTPGPLPGRMSS